MSELTEGTYTVSVVEHGIVKLNEKATARLGFSNGAVWFGSFAGGAAEWTAKALVNAGFYGTKKEQLNIDGAIEVDRKCQIVLKNEEYNGKTRLKVKFINKLAERMSDKEMAVMLGGIDVDAHLASARADLGIKGVVVTKQSPLQGGTITTDDIPF